MIRVGLYTGKVYSQEDYDDHKIKECCIVASPSLPKTRSIDEAQKKAAWKKIVNCYDCESPCEERQKDNGGIVHELY